jgi:bifunctional DNA-binding transcriptional regulator/antitoxin component of YhaV-PrlF toxin-antitoxin module
MTKTFWTRLSNDSITIPESLRKRLKLKGGDEIQIVVDDQDQISLSFRRKPVSPARPLFRQAMQSTAQRQNTTTLVWPNW